MRVGPIIILMGLILCMAGVALGLFQMATVVYANVVNYSPNGTQENPTTALRGTQITGAIVLEEEVTENPIAQVYSEGNLVDTLEFTRKFTLAGAWIYQAFADLGFTVPSDVPLGTVYKWDFILPSYADSPVVTAYVEVVDVSARFKINGINVDENSVIVVTDPTLVIELIATANGHEITGCSLAITNPDGKKQTMGVPEVETDKTWRLEYTLPTEGTYSIIGYYVVGASSYTAMNVLAGFTLNGDGLDWSEWKLEVPMFSMHPVTWLGLGTTSLGIIITIVESRKHRRK